jgi:hypothetical protein
MASSIGAFDCAIAEKARLYPECMLRSGNRYIIDHLETQDQVDDEKELETFGPFGVWAAEFPSVIIVFERDRFSIFCTHSLSFLQMECLTAGISTQFESHS